MKRASRGMLAVVAVGALAAGTLPVVGVSTSVAATSSDAPDQQGIVATGNGVAGVPQAIDIIAPRLPGAQLRVVAFAASASDVMDVTLDADGYGSARWTPSAAGVWTVGASGAGLELRMSKATISAMPTITDIYIPSKAERFVPMGLIATVRAAQPGMDVAGTVTFYEGTLGRLGSVEVDPLPGRRSLANFTWAPPSDGTFSFHAEFTPAIDPATGTAASQASVSGVSPLVVETHPVAIQLLMSPEPRIGHPALIVAQLPAIYRGTVALDIDGRQVEDAKETEGGIAVFDWIPTHAGLTYVQLELVSGGRLGLLDRMVTQTVNVQPQLVPNPMSVTPVIDGVPGKPWADGDLRTYKAGTRIQLASSTGTGSAVTISQVGKCLVTGVVLYVPSAGGGCKVTFSTPGDAQYAPNSAEIIVSGSVVTATATTKPSTSASGKGKGRQ